ncbi:MAG: hypothetical protein KBB39_10775 [Phycicoccus sp.]|nr:hypothetical protein [Phycicoccus sp.]
MRPERIEDYDARITAALGPHRRPEAGAVEVVTWDVFPFEADGLAVKPVDGLVSQEAPRFGEDPAGCWCAEGSPWGTVVWSNPDWLLLSPTETSGSPLVLTLVPRAHHDAGQLPDALAQSWGLLTTAIMAAAIMAAVESLPSVARCHLGRWGDGGAHAHYLFLARPARMPQLRGSPMVLWDDFLPPVPALVREANAAAVVDRLVARVGGERG